MALPAEKPDAGAPSLETATVPGILPSGYKLTGILDIAGEDAHSSSNGGLSTTTFEAIGPDNRAHFVVRFFPFGLSRDPVRMQALRGSLQAAVRLRHPNIVPIVGSGLVAGRPYVVMPFVPAGSLEDRFSLGAVSGLDVARSIGEVAGALDYVHSRGMVHGRLRPSKVLFDESGTVQVTGFGEVVSDRVHSPNGSNGTKDLYDAPEVKAGGPSTRAADQYAFTLMALEMLTGRPAEEALQALKASTETSKLDRSARPIRARFDLASAVAGVLVQGLATDPAQRPPSVGALNRALRVAMGVDVPTRPVAKAPPALQPVRRPARRVRLSVLAPALALALCLLVAVPLALAGRLGGAHTGTSGPSSGGSEAGVQSAVAGGPLLVPGDGAIVSHDGDQAGFGVPGPDQAAPEGSSDSSAPASDADPSLPPSSVPEPTPTPAEVAAGAPGETTGGPTGGDPISTPVDPPPPPPTATEAPAKHSNPKSCKDDPTHPNYCPPTPVP